MSCPHCGKKTNRVEKEFFEKGKYDEALPEIEVMNIILACSECGYGWNCIGTKKI